MAGSRILLNGFKMATVGHTAIGLWRHPDNHAPRYKTLDYWISTAKTLEAGRFDSLFIADSLGIFDSYGASQDAALRHAIHVPVIDPLLIISAMASHTRKLGFAVTVSATYEQPYAFARKMTTLDHLTEGRIGWNIVTSGLDSAARNLGLAKQVAHDDRYAMADEFMDVVYKLWEGSWEEDAVVMDRERGIFADPAKVHPIGHHGTHFSVPDSFISEPSIQRTPVLFQAGASATGRAFAARHAEAIFLNETDPAKAKKIVHSVRELAERAGRDPLSIKFISGATVVTGSNDEAAERKFASYKACLSEEGTLARYASIVQMDLSGIDLDLPLEYVETDGIRTALERFARGNRTWTPRQISQHLATSLGGICFVGSGATIADRMEEWVAEAEVDGFNIGDAMPLLSFEEFIAHVTPELRKRGRLSDRYEGDTLREHIYGPSHARIGEDHPAAAFRR